MHAETRQRLIDYLKRLAGNSNLAGNRLKRVLESGLMYLHDETTFLQALLDTKPPMIFAESAVHGDGSDWSADELGILGDIGIAADVTIYDDGRHQNPTVFEEPFSGTLLFIPGALLRNGQGKEPADWAIVKDGKVDADLFEALYERRLLPLLAYAGRSAEARGRSAFITIPGLGCGQFAGKFKGTLGSLLRDALYGILSRHCESLSGIRAVWYDPYRECENGRHEIGHLSFFTRPLCEIDTGLSQLCHPQSYEEAGDDFSECDLYSVVAWDHVSWPGNDFYGGLRSTDDGVKAAATDLMLTMTGFPGNYNPFTYAYEPPDDFRTWGELVANQRIQIKVADNVIAIG
ncbi:MAG: hypothetical protein HN368_02645 [Spirochaetales bacterium]|nr:hypothetical protein [Spirochaetales bacterium]